MSQTKEESGIVDLSESETWSFHEEDVTVRLVAYKLAIGKRGDRQAYCATELIKSQMPKPTCSQTRCFVWGKWAMIRMQLGRTKLNGIRRIITSKN